MADATSQFELNITIPVNFGTSGDPLFSVKNTLCGQKHKRCRSQLKARTRIRRLKR